MMKWRHGTGLLVAVVLILSGCSISVPTDPDGTLARVSGGTLRAGVSPHPPWTLVDGTGRPTGQEVELVDEFAQRIQADVVWAVGGEEQLITRLEHDQLDLVIGGLTADTPWSEKVAVTRPYRGTTDAVGRPVELVMVTAMGENAFLQELERFLHERTES